MIAPGTGVAPCRALMWERRKAQMMSLKGLPLADLKPREIPFTLKPSDVPTPAKSLPYEKNQTYENPSSPRSADKPRPSIESTPAKTYEKNRTIRAGDKGPSKNFAFAPSLLFFGNRNAKADYFFHEEWDEMKLQVFTAFSRDQEKKIYIQDVIRREGALVNERIKEGAIIYVCGSSGNMPKAVKEALLSVLMGITPKEPGLKLLEPEEAEKRLVAEKRLEELEREGRYIQETW